MTRTEKADLSKAKFQPLDWVKKVDGRDKKEYRICDTVICGLKSDMIGYTLLFQKGENVYKTNFAIVEDALIPFNFDMENKEKTNDPN